MPIYRDDPSFVIRPKRMSDPALAEFLSARPCVNADVVLYNRERRTIYLPTRISRPADGLWVIGGALKAGELPTDTLVRRIQAETGGEAGLRIDPSRLEYLGVFHFVWSYRKEAPSADGRHDINFVYALAATDTELSTAAAHLDPAEYAPEAGLKPFASVEALRQAGARPCLIDYYRALFPDEA